MTHVIRSSYGIVEYTPNVFLQSDLDLFYSNVAPQIATGTAPIIDLIDGANLNTTARSFNFQGESDLDLQYAIALGI
jgi:tripeptidyl-peptidase-1